MMSCFDLRSFAALRMTPGEQLRLLRDLADRSHSALTMNENVISTVQKSLFEILLHFIIYIFRLFYLLDIIIVEVIFSQFIDDLFCI